MIKLAGLALTLSLGTLGCEHKKDSPKVGGSTTTPPPTNPMPPEAVKKDPGPAKTVDGELRAPTAADLATYTQNIKGSGKLTAVIEVATGASGETPVGTFHCELFGDKAPMTVANFVGLATGQKAWLNPKTGTTEKGTPYFDGILFHRVIAGFMIQGGDPLGVGRGGPGYTFDDEQNGVGMVPGALAMANAGPSTNGSQFFIVEGKPEHQVQRLNGRHTVFGQCKEIDLVEKIAALPLQGERPNPSIMMKKITITKE